VPSPSIAPPAPPRPPRRLRTFDSLLEVPPFRWYLVSMTGNWSALQMQQVVRGFLAYQITGSFAALGGVALANSMPRLFFALSGGVVADRASRRSVMQAGQAFNALLAFAIGALLFAGRLRFEHLVIGAVLQGISNSFTQPARQALIPEIVGLERLTNAFALSVFAMNTTRLAAPALAGVLLAATDAGWVYALMGTLYVLAVVTMFRVPQPRATRASAAEAAAAEPGGGAAATARPRRPDRSGMRAIGDALRYVQRQPVLRMLLIVHVFIGMLSMPYQRLLPGFVDDVLSTSPDQTALRMGALLAATAVGALVGSLVIASLPDRGRGRLLIGSLAVFGLGLAMFSGSTRFWLSMPVALLLGVGQSGRQSLNNILIQTHTTNEYRGRVSSIMQVEDGIESLGVFAVSLVAATLGAQLALGLVSAGLLVLAGTLWFLAPTYRRLE